MTDDLTRRARARADEPWPLWDQDSPALLMELADALEELQGERDRWKARWQATVADADAARAALERVRGLVETAELAAPFGKPPYWTGHILNALEGKS